MTKQSTSKIYTRPVVVAGATGSQGGAVARRLLKRGHAVRALTRSPDKPAAIALKRSGAEIVEADLTDRTALEGALAGAGAVFSVQDFLEAGVEVEVTMGFNLADAAAAAGVDHIVYNGACTQDRSTGVPHLDSKWRVEQRVRSLDIPWTVLRPAAFMDNWAWDREEIEREGFITLPLAPTTVYRQVAVADIAAMAVVALEHPDVWTGRIVPLAGEVSTPMEIAETFSRVIGRPVRYVRMSWDACLRTQGEDLTAMYRYFDQFGQDGDPHFLKRWYPDALSLEDFLRADGWETPKGAQ